MRRRARRRGTERPLRADSDNRAENRVPTGTRNALRRRRSAQSAGRRGAAGIVPMRIVLARRTTAVSGPRVPHSGRRAARRPRAGSAERLMESGAGSARRLDLSSTRSAARPQAWFPAASRPAAGNPATCRIRSASPPAHPGRSGPRLQFLPVRRGSPGGRIACAAWPVRRLPRHPSGSSTDDDGIVIVEVQADSEATGAKTVQGSKATRSEFSCAVNPRVKRRS